ncbi:hypothetical protein D6D01_04252 [Aureobasidium pullulans]|uniref:F-box domain-containing protein n=1 Tax=Aureobasidium pullulans TaxID=5580 RepID=A0A4S9LE64_AURPU|nr:hypothetical protein D6D01_04252 [Aureobasidium pullulans]
MATSINARSILPTLPLELLGRVFDFVDDKDLISLRLVCKDICAAANRPFAICFFAESRHVVTQHSIETLLKVSSHAVFGPFIRKIMVSPARLPANVIEHAADVDPDPDSNDPDGNLDENADEDMEDGVVVDNAFVKSGQFSILMQQIFANAKHNPHPITIAVHEDRYITLSPNQYYMPHSHKRCYGSRAFYTDSRSAPIFRTAETINLVSAAADAVGLITSALEIDLMSVPRDSVELSTQKAIHDFLQARTMPLDVHLSWDDCSTLRFEHREARLCFSASSLLIPHPRWDTHLRTLNKVVQWLNKNPILELQLEDLEVERLSFLDGYFSQFLRSIKLEDIKLGSTFFDKGLYSSLFEQFSGLLNLTYCGLSRLHYRLPEEGGHTKMHLFSGSYPTAWISLLLVFPDGQTEYELKGHGVCRELEDLAAYTAAAERRKVLTIQADQEVIDYRVAGADAPIDYEKEDFEYRSR